MMEDAVADEKIDPAIAQGYAYRAAQGGAPAEVQRVPVGLPRAALGRWADGWRAADLDVVHGKPCQLCLRPLSPFEAPALLPPVPQQDPPQAPQELAEEADGAQPVVRIIVTPRKAGRGYQVRVGMTGGRGRLYNKATLFEALQTAGVELDAMLEAEASKVDDKEDTSDDDDETDG